MRKYEIIKTDFIEECKRPKHYTGHTEDFNIMEFIGIVTTVSAGIMFIAVLVIQILKIRGII